MLHGGLLRGSMLCDIYKKNINEWHWTERTLSLDLKQNWHTIDIDCVPREDCGGLMNP